MIQMTMLTRPPGFILWAGCSDGEAWKGEEGSDKIPHPSCTRCWESDRLLEGDK